VPEGVLPAFDEALAFIRADSEGLKKKASEMKVELGRLRKEAEGQASESEAWAKVRELEEKVQDTLLQSEVNLPDIRWKAKNGMGECFPCISRL
jgi:large subunit ribosomal protein L35